MKRLIILAALLLSVVGGLTFVSSASPLAAQSASATRSFEPAQVMPGPGTQVTVHIDIEGANFGTVTEMVPAGFEYVSTTGRLYSSSSDVLMGKQLVFTFRPDDPSQGYTKDFSYTLEVPSATDDYDFSGTLNPGSVAVGGETVLTVSTGPAPNEVAPAAGFDVVPAKALAGATVSGVGHPIATAPLMWDVSDVAGEGTPTLEGEGMVGDFQIVSVGSGKYQLKVVTSGAPMLDASGSQAIRVDLDYDDSKVILTGMVTKQQPLTIAEEFVFTIPRNVAEDTPIGSFDVSGKIGDEPLDGMITNDVDAEPFGVLDRNMTIYKANDDLLDVRDYKFKLTVNGDAGLAARVVRADVTVRVSASNDAHIVEPSYSKTLDENVMGDGLVSADTQVVDAKTLVTEVDNDNLKYTLVGGDGFQIDDGNVTVGPGDIGDGNAGDHEFGIMVSDGVSANDATIDVTVTVVENNRVMAKTEDVGGVTAPTDSSENWTFESPALAGTLSNPVKLFSFADLVEGATDPYDVAVYEIVAIDDPLAPLNLDDNGDLEVTHIPEKVRRSDTLSGTYKVTVGVNDGFNINKNEEVKQPDGMSYNPPRYVDDATITVEVTIRVQPAPSRLFPSVTVSVDEETPADGEDNPILGAIATPATATAHPELADLIANIGDDDMTYTHISGNNAGAVVTDEQNEYFSVDASTGAVTMTKSISYEDIVTMSGDVMQPTLTIEVKRDSDAADLGFITLTVKVADVNEAPMFGADVDTTLNAKENANDGEDINSPIKANDVDAGDMITYSIKETGVPFKVATMDGAAQIQKMGDDKLRLSPDYDVTLVATDSDGATDKISLTIKVGDVNDPPKFAADTQLEVTIPEDLAVGANVLSSDTDGNEDADGMFNATDQDGDTLKFSVENATDSTVFALDEDTGELTLLKKLNYEATKEYELDIKVQDVPGEGEDALDARTELKIHITNVNDNAPVIVGSGGAIVSVDENSPRGTPIGDYKATDDDGDGPVLVYKVDDENFAMTSDGKLITVASLDYESMAPAGIDCGMTYCNVKITIDDAAGGPRSADHPGVTTMDVRVEIRDVSDSITNLSVSKANPIANISDLSEDNAMSALADAKMSISAAVPESPDLPAMEGDAPMDFVSADWGNWGTVLRIEVTAESPDADCGNGNQCVFLGLEADSSDDKVRLEAYRSSTKENLFIAAVKLVERGDDGTDAAVTPVYQHDDGSVARLFVDEEDSVEIRLIEKNEKGDAFEASKVAPITVEVENEEPEFNNFMPEHESAFDDGDVDYTFTVTDTVSGIPEPEDLPDGNGDADYMPLVALMTTQTVGQCHTENPNDKAYSDYDYAGNVVWCKSEPKVWAITDDRDFDEIDDGFEVDTKIVLDENEQHYVTFVVCDNAGNCELYTPDENDTKKAFAEITIDTVKPELTEARTGIMWDATDAKYDDDPTFIQLLFTDLTALDPTTIEVDDFVVEGHTVKEVHWYDVADGDDDTCWADGDLSDCSRFVVNNGDKGPKNIGGRGYLRQNIRNSVFLELEDQLAPDETPDVSVVPNGVSDSAGKEQDDGEKEADDWIAPSFTIVVNPTARTPQGSGNVLAGDGDEVVINLTADERIVKTRPDVEVIYVNAPKGCVNTANKSDANPYDRGQIKTGVGNCGSSATGTSPLGTTIEKVSNTEWTVTVDEPESTGYYNIYVWAQDRSSQKNKGSEGISEADVAKKFFERDGDVNSDDAYYFQGDINLANPNVRVSGEQILETEPSVEFKTPLFVEIDFTEAYLYDKESKKSQCTSDMSKDDKMAKCLEEDEEYAKDSFESVTITSFTLNGTDMTDMVKTTDDKTFLVAIDNPGIQDHEIEIQAVDQAGNTLDKALSVEFEVEERDDYTKRLNPGWNLVSIPGEPADSDISVVFGSDIEVRTVYTYNPIIPGGWMVAVRESMDSEWQGDLKEITARQGYWVLSDAIQDWDVSIPRLAGGAVGTGTPIQPPVIALYAGWNLVPVIDVTGDFAGDGISATAYLQSLDDGLDLARVLGFDTITNTWSTIMAPEGCNGCQEADTLEYGSAYWVFVRQAASLVPGN